MFETQGGAGSLRPRRQTRRDRTRLTRSRATAAVTGSVLVLGALNLVPAYAASVTNAVFTGGVGTVKVGDTLYAKQGATLTLTVTTSNDTKCVDVAGAITGHQQSNSAKTSWTFGTTAGAGDGAQSVTVTASPNFNNQDKCTGNTNSGQASYTLDNTGPVVMGALSPAPNAAGWNKDNVNIAWTASDAGSGIGSGPTPGTETQNAPTSGTVKTATATDRLGNTGTGSVTVRLDKGAPTITGSRTPAANANGWNNTDVTVSFACQDNGPSGIKSCPGPTTLTSNAASQSVTGKAVDNADNEMTATVGNINIDKVAPTLSGAPTTDPNGDGWYNGDVTIRWTAGDALSGLAGSAPADSKLTGQGESLTASTSVSDKAGNSTSATSAPVKIDRTAPTTAISGDSNEWTTGDVTVSLTASDNLSGVASTTYAVDGSAPQTGRSFTLSDDGDHTVTFYSTDRAGNVEAARTAHVRIDKTAPTIGHSFIPESYTDGAWTNQNVTVKFTCDDQGGSKVASCTGDTTVSSQGKDQKVVGTATDNAGNTATNEATISIDKTPPTVTGSADREPNGADWYNGDVTVSFTAKDALSGVVFTSEAQTLGEGENQSAVGTARDAAGNEGTATVSGINVDKTAPELTASYDKGWHTGDVTVHWTCTDELSGPVGQPDDDTVTGEGGNLSSTATCTDRAGNTVTETVTGIQIDRTAPTTTSEVDEPLKSGWYGGPVDVTLTGHDGVSGIAKTYYSVDGGARQEYTETFSFGLKGEHTISYWSVDNAGNAEDESVNSITLKIDGNPPTTEVVNPISPASGWFVESGIPVAFKATDPESGIAATYYTIDGGEERTYGEPFTEQLGDGEHTIAYWSVDLAGNVEEAQTTTFYVDTVAPTIEGTQSPAANAFGWNNTEVTVTFTCDDQRSGIDKCLADGGDGASKTVGEGRDQSVTGTATDKAGHSAQATVTVNVDKTAPTNVSFVGGPADGGRYYPTTVPAAPTCTADDALSGLAGCEVSGYSTALGEHTLTAKATDRAGNATTVTRKYSVRSLTVKGFFAPVDMGGVFNTVKGGSTVPLKFKVFDGATELITTGAIGASFTAKAITCPTGNLATDEIEVLSTGATSLRYDTTAGQFIQNWQTPRKPGACYAVTVTTVDGSTQTANFLLK
jgi:hypothetical protein